MISVLLALSGSDDPPAKCFRMNQHGELPTCTYSGGEWTRSYPSSGFGSGPGGGFAPYGSSMRAPDTHWGPSAHGGGSGHPYGGFLAHRFHIRSPFSEEFQ